MLDRIVTRALKVIRPEPPPPPPPKLKPLEQLADAARRVDATPEVQQGARARFAATGADARDRMHDEPSTRGGKVGDAERVIQRNADAVRDAPNDEARDAATLTATRELPRVLEELSPAQRREVLRDNQDALRTISGGLDHLDDGETKQAIGHLGDAAELAGNDGAHLVAKPLADALPALNAGHDDNFGEISGALVDNVKEGRGALLSAALVHEVSARGDVRSANTLALNHKVALTDVREDYEEARAKADRLDAVLANQVSSWQGTLTPQQIQAGVDRFMEEHEDAYAARDDAAATMASTLPGAAYTADHPVTRAGLVEQGALVDESRAQLESVPRLVQTESGTESVADALAARGRGETTFLDAAQRVASTPDQKELFESSILRATGARGDALAREGRLGEVPDMLRGAAGLVEDEALGRVLESYGDDVQQIADKDLPPEQAARQLLSASTAALNQAQSPKVARHLSPDSLPKFAAVARGLGIGGVAAAGVNFANDPSIRSGLETLNSALPASVAFTEGATRAALSKAGLAATVAFSAFDTVSALKRGDFGDAALAAAPAAGVALGAGAGAWFFGVGAIPGGIIGGAVGTIVQVGAKLFGGGGDEKEEAIKQYEEDADPFLRGALGEAGLPEDAAHRLRDVDEDLVHVGGVFPPLAERMGITPQELLARVARLPDDQRESFVKTALQIDHNGDDVRQAIEDGREPPALRYDAGGLDGMMSYIRGSNWPSLRSG